MVKSVEKGFTLIEVTAVLILMGLAALLIVPEITRTVEKGNVNFTKNQIVTLQGVLDEYKLENGSYPTTEQGLAALLAQPTVPPVPEEWNGPYIKELQNDPWKRPFNYRCPGEHNKDGYDLWSYGADGQEGGTGFDADITNWKE